MLELFIPFECILSTENSLDVNCESPILLLEPFWFNSFSWDALLRLDSLDEALLITSTLWYGKLKTIPSSINSGQHPKLCH